MKRLIILCTSIWLGACATNPEKFTLADLQHVEPVLEEVDVSQSLEKAMHGYREFLANTDTNNKTPEALRRLADLKIEQEFGVLVSPGKVDAPDLIGRAVQRSTPDMADAADDQDLEARAGQLHNSLESRSAVVSNAKELIPGQTTTDLTADSGSNPQQAIATYKRILDEYPYYERNDQVLYQMARAYDELAETELAMEATQRLITEYPRSRFVDEVFFRRGEYFFVRRKYLDAEESYAAVVAAGPEADFYELARYKLGWSLYKQEMYAESLEHYLALLDFKLSRGYDFSNPVESADNEDERRVADTFRVISLAFSNLGGAEVLTEYFADSGNRAYESRIYRNLGEFYVEKLRFNDAAEVYGSFVDQNPLHQIAPHFSMRVTEIYSEGGFPQLVVESKKDFAQRYGLNAPYWAEYALSEMPEVEDYLKTNLMDLAQHYHAIYQDVERLDDQPANYVEAQHWYDEFLTSFAQAEEAPGIHYKLADLHLEHKAFPEAATAYERTAYDYVQHEQSSSAGYAAIFAHRENLKTVASSDHDTTLRTTISSSLRFAETFPDHEHAASVLGAASDDLYSLAAYAEAIDAGQKLITQHPDADVALQRRAWTVVSHAHFDLEEYAHAEAGYLEVLGLLQADAENRSEINENLAAAIYQQGEIARAAEDHMAAADHFLRVKTLAPGASIQPAAEYDAAASKVALESWDESTLR